MLSSSMLPTWHKFVLARYTDACGEWLVHVFEVYRGINVRDLGQGYQNNSTKLLEIEVETLKLRHVRS